MSWLPPSIPLPGLEAVALIIYMGSIPVSGAIGKPKPADSSTGFVLLTVNLTDKRFITLLFPPARLAPLARACPFPPSHRAWTARSDAHTASLC